MSLEECKDLKQRAGECRLKVDTYIDKLGAQSDKLAEAIGDSDSELTEKIIEEDNSLFEKALSVSYKLTFLDEELVGKKETTLKRETEELVPSPVSENFQRMFDQQMKLQNNILAQQEEHHVFQMKLQQDLFDKKSEKKSTHVKLPKIDLIQFNGNKLQWLEFWDSFEAAVHENDSLSNVDKFNYLRGKLTGEAKEAVAGLSLSNENYYVAVKLLHDRFGDKQEMIDLHYNKLINIAPARNTTESLRFFLDKFERHIRSLEVLGENVNQNVFVSMIQRKIPSDVRLQLEMLKEPNTVWKVSKLRALLHRYIGSKEKAGKPQVVESTRQPTWTKPDNYKTIQTKPLYSSRSFANVSRPAETLVASEKEKASSQAIKRCRYCDKSHWSDECTKYRTLEQRKQRLKGCCFRCLKDNHFAKDCKTSKSCVYCGQKDVHHRSICGKRFRAFPLKESVHLSEEPSWESTEMVSEEVGLLSCHETVPMQTATTEVKNKTANNGEMVRLLLDSGSHRTYVTQALANRLGLEAQAEQTIHVTTFGSEKAKELKTKTTTMSLKLKNGKFMEITVHIVPNISGTIHRYPVKISSPEKLAHFTSNLQLADWIPTEKESNTLELLVGNDYYLDIIESDKIEVSPGLYLLSSILGWILSGRAETSETQREDCDMNMLILTYGNNIIGNNVLTSVDRAVPVKPDLESFWNIESIGITDKCDQSDSEKVMEDFKSTLRREDGIYQVTWPWRDGIPDLPENRGLAVGRLRYLANKLVRHPEIMQRYNDTIQEQLNRGIIERVDRTSCDGIKHYLPHHAVIKPGKTTTKLRVVYDASAKTRADNKSLNECLHKGPVLLRDLCGILLRFRLPMIGIVSDIEKAFLQVGLQPSQRYITRFLWFKDYQDPRVVENNLQEYRFRRVPFGAISSPFLLGATIESHLDTYLSPLSSKLKVNTYMDNIITGTDSVSEAIDKCQLNVQ